jgi:hypothetical protein
MVRIVTRHPTILAFFAVLTTAIALAVGVVVNNTPVRIGTSAHAGAATPAAKGLTGQESSERPAASVTSSNEDTLQSNFAFLLIGIGAAMAASGGLVWLIAHRQAAAVNSQSPVARGERSPAFRDAA